MALWPQVAQIDWGCGVALMAFSNSQKVAHFLVSTI
jgi:hypothetical protein